MFRGWPAEGTPQLAFYLLDRNVSDQEWLLGSLLCSNYFFKKAAGEENPLLLPYFNMRKVPGISLHHPLIRKNCTAKGGVGSVGAVL